MRIVRYCENVIFFSIGFLLWIFLAQESITHIYNYVSQSTMCESVTMRESVSYCKLSYEISYLLWITCSHWIIRVYVEIKANPDIFKTLYDQSWIRGALNRDNNEPRETRKSKDWYRLGSITYFLYFYCFTSKLTICRLLFTVFTISD